MQDPLTLKLIIVAMAATVVAVVIALVLSYRISRKLMDQNASMAAHIEEGGRQHDSSHHALEQAKTQLESAQRERDAVAQQLVAVEHRLKLAEDKLNEVTQQTDTTAQSSQMLNQEIKMVSSVEQMSDEQLMEWIVYDVETFFQIVSYTWFCGILMLMPLFCHLSSTISESADELCFTRV